MNYARVVGAASDCAVIADVYRESRCRDDRVRGSFIAARLRHDATRARSGSRHRHDAADDIGAGASGRRPPA